MNKQLKHYAELIEVHKFQTLLLYLSIPALELMLQGEGDDTRRHPEVDGERLVHIPGQARRVGAGADRRPAARPTAAGRAGHRAGHPRGENAADAT